MPNYRPSRQFKQQSSPKLTGKQAGPANAETRYGKDHMRSGRRAPVRLFARFSLNAAREAVLVPLLFFVGLAVFKCLFEFLL